MKARKTWREKMNNPNLPKVVPVLPQMRKRYGQGTMLVPSPKEVDAFMRTVAKGQVATLTQIREFLAARYAVDVTCPLTTGIFVHIAAEVAEEDAMAGKRRITPYWRIVKDDGSLNPKFPGGVARQAERLRAEGHRILPGSARQPPRVVLPGDGRRPRGT
ncbi:MAG TPA: MGMT family protein [Bryobacteraceae bacterium]|nr:MGMT family protein [Bryobacteraceae bacterium]